jgi:pimeloyl-ACP methyl ester carboxylesterase
MPSFLLRTVHGLISINDTALKNDRPALLLLHGNSSSSKQFRHIIDSPTLNKFWRIVTFDLPGHGCSSNAPDVKKTYSHRGYADLAIHVLQHLRIESVVIMGWSLGGHIGIEMLPLLAHRDRYLVDDTPRIHVKGLMLVGTPPAHGAEQMSHAFKTPNGGLSFPGNRNWADTEAELYLKRGVASSKKECYEKWMLEDAKRTDGRARVLITDAATGTEDSPPKGCDQKRVVEETDVLIAVVNGAEDQFVNLDYLDKEVKWNRPWKGECIRLAGLGHAPFWEDAKVFEKVLGEFLEDCGE